MSFWHPGILATAAASLSEVLLTSASFIPGMIKAVNGSLFLLKTVLGSLLISELLGQLSPQGSSVAHFCEV
jgi:hypothetical protein